MLIEDIALDHVAIAVPRIAGVIDAVGGTMGGKRHLAGPGQGFVFAQWAYRRGELVEVIEPEGKPSGFVHRFLEAHGAGVHHITFKVGDKGCGYYAESEAADEAKPKANEKADGGGADPRGLLRC